MRGYCGIAIYHPLHGVNIGTLWRTAHSFGVDWLATIGRRYQRQASDTTDAGKHIPYYDYQDFEDFYGNLPLGCQLVCVERATNARSLITFEHPERAVYLLGAEDYGLPPHILDTRLVIEIPNLHYCLNVSVAGAIVLYD